MNIFLSAEVDKGVGELWRIARGEINPRLQKVVSVRDYGSSICDISIVPSIFSEESPEWRDRKERKKVSLSKGTADLRLNIDYRDFISGDDKNRVKLLLENILQSIEVVNEKVPEFKGDVLKKDIEMEFEKELL